MIGQKLSERLADQRRERPINLVALAEQLGVPATAFYRALQRAASEEVSQLLGDQLGFSARFVALVHHRDALRRALEREQARAQRREPRIAALRRRVDELDVELGYENPYSARGSCERLAFTVLRRRCGLTMKQLAELHASRTGTSLKNQFAAIRAYEGNRPYNQWELDRWVETLRAHAPAGVAASKRELERLANTLQQVHVIGDTMEWREVVGARSSGAMQVFGAPERDEKRKMRWGQSGTSFGAIRIDVIDVEQPEPLKRGVMRLVNAGHQTFQLGVVVRGRIRVDFSRAKFPRENREPPTSVAGDESLVEPGRTFRQGEVLAFKSQIWHRVEFLGERNLVLMILIGRNVSLGRRLGRRKHDRS